MGVFTRPSPLYLTHEEVDRMEKFFWTGIIAKRNGHRWDHLHIVIEHVPSVDAFKVKIINTHKNVTHNVMSDWSLSRE